MLIAFVLTFSLAWERELAGRNLGVRTFLNIAGAILKSTATWQRSIYRDYGR